MAKQIRIENRGAVVLEKDIEELEELVGFTLPSDYRKFLMEFNGGQPYPNSIKIIGLDTSPTDIQTLFGIRRSEKTSNIIWNLSVLSSSIEFIGIPIACDSGGAIFWLKSDYSVSYVLPFGDFPQTYVAADSFAGLLDALF